MKVQANAAATLEVGRENLPPFLKWAGGKRWFCKELAELLPGKFERFIEPFAGSAASFFAIRPERAILADTNEELINTYRVMASAPDSLFDALKAHQRSHSDSYYYEIRAGECSSSLARAARFIYLNRTCWNGLYRVNKQGKFNVPRGTKDAVILSTDDFSEYAKILSSADFLHCDFELTVDMASRGDVLFVDPPYTVAHNNNGFVKYNETIFSWKDQIRLKDSLIRASDRGAIVIATNAAHPSVLELYGGCAKIRRVQRASILAGNASFRRTTEELLITIGISHA